MDLKKILIVTGKPGLFQLVSQTKSGFIVENLQDKKKIPVFANDRVSSLEDISLFTKEDDEPLRNVFLALFKKLNGEKAIDPKSDKKELITFMNENYPEWDEERVYPSDIKKLLNWYNQLIDHNLIDDKPAEDSNDAEAGEKSE